MAHKIFKSKGIFIPVIGYSDIEVQSIKDLPGEIWKEFYVGDLCYYASSLGRIKRGNSIVYWNNGKKVCCRCLKPIILRGTLTTDGYIRISIGKKKTFFVHRLIASCFIGSSFLEVNHINGNKLDNRLSNLEYVSRLDNMRHAKKTGLIKDFYSNFKGKISNPRKLDEDSVNKIRELFFSKKKKQKELAIMFDVHKDTIGRVCRYISPYND